MYTRPERNDDSMSLQTFMYVDMSDSRGTTVYDTCQILQHDSATIFDD
jgi:hypothetical protein